MANLSAPERTSDGGKRGSDTESPKSYQKTEEDPNRIWDDLPKHLRIKKRTAYIRRHSDQKVSSKYRKFKLLMWKNFIVSKRRWKSSLLQFLAPTFFVTLMIIYFSNSQDSGYDDKIYPYFGVDELHDVFYAFKDCDTIYLLPNNTILRYFKDHLHNLEKDMLKFEFLNTSTSDPSPSNLCALIQFNENMWANGSHPEDEFPTMISYEIRFPAVHESKRTTISSLISIGETWDTAFRDPTYMVDGAREIESDTGGHPGYFYSGFLYIQHKIALELMQTVLEVEGAKTSPQHQQLYRDKFAELIGKLLIRLRRFPFPGHSSEVGVRTIANTLPTVLVIGFGTSCVIMAFLSVREKEMGVRQLLKMYGIVERYHKYAWILHNMIFQSISALIMSIIISTSWKNTITSDALLEDEFLGQIFFFLIVCYTFNIICAVTLLVCFFSRASTACVTVCFIFCVSFMPYFYIKEFFNIYSFWGKLAACLPSNTAIGIGCLIIAEMQAEGNAQLSWYDVWSYNEDGFSVGKVMIVLVGTGMVELLLSWYISLVFPEEGVHKLPWNFMFKAWFWQNQHPPDEVPIEKSQEKSFEDSHPSYFEDDSTTKQRKELCIENLSKYYGQHRALHKVNLICYQGHVTVLLGDQGSGKSSLLKLLTGTHSPSSGTIYLSRKDLGKNKILARAFVGYCPSQDLLFPDLTVEETIQFFTDLKGLTNPIEAYEEVERLLKITLLQDFRSTRVCELTKSSQRMLMVATAFCGGSRVVLLDDPTLNLSASQQRVLWDFASQEKKHRTILVAMDLVHEMDKVVDKVVLLHYGQLTAKGSPDFLKNKFGGGYHLEVEVKGDSDHYALDDLIQRRIEGSRLFKSDREGRKLDFYLPQTETAAFPGVLEEFQNSAESYGIISHRVKFVTLEELHLRLKRLSTSLDEVTSAFRGTEDDPSSHRRRRSKKKQRSEVNIKQAKQLSQKMSLATIIREFKVMCKKNLKYSLRHGVLLLTTTIIPLIILTLAALLAKTLELKLDTIPHLLNHSEYGNPSILCDMYRSTNQGIYMRDSVSRIIAKDNWVKRKIIDHEDDLVTAILKDYNRAENENDVSNLAIEIVPAVLDESNPNSIVKVGITGYFNNQPLHTPAVVMALLGNILMDHAEGFIQREVAKDYVPKGYFFNVSNHPITYQPADRVKFSQILIGPGYLFGVYTSFIYSFLISSYLVMHIKEQEFRHMQMVFGANKLIFWGSNYLLNMLHFTVVAIGNALILIFVGVPGYPVPIMERLPVVGTIFLFLEMYGLTGVCLVGTCASISFTSWGRGFSKLVLSLIITGPLMMLLMIPMQNDQKVGIARGGFSYVHNFFLLFPSYSFGSGLFFIVANAIHNTQCPKFKDKIGQKQCPDRTIHPWNEFDHDGSVYHSCCFNRQDALSFVSYGVGRNIFCMLLTVVVCILQKVFSYSKRMRLLLKKVLDKKSKYWHPFSPVEHEIKDYDVVAETAKIDRGEDDHDLTIKNLTLETPVYTKLDHICLEVKRGECFAFLGAHGAGKSTFLKTLYGYHNFPTFGDVELHGLSLIRDYDEYIKAFSYSADHNPFLTELTGEEVLQIIGTLRRIRQDTLDEYIASIGDNFGMTIEMEQPIKEYSFVLVKKLCMAAALLGNFQVLLLDNPTHHLDLKSRKFIIEKIKGLMENGCIIIWASHGIEHCEKICSKMSVLVNGHLKCIGSPEHLRELYEEGFTVIVRFILDKDMVYFTSKKEIRRENEIREIKLDDEEAGKETHPETKQDKRKKQLSMMLHEDDEKLELALSGLAPWERDLCPFVEFFEKAFPDSILVDIQPGFVHYHVGEGKATWAELFKKMEEAKVVAEVESYYITSTNLDQVFFNFTRGQVVFDGNAK